LWERGIKKKCHAVGEIGASVLHAPISVYYNLEDWLSELATGVKENAVI